MMKVIFFVLTLTALLIAFATAIFVVWWLLRVALRSLRQLLSKPLMPDRSMHHERKILRELHLKRSPE